MSRITIEDVARELDTQNWRVLSEEYKNLQTEMKFQCPEGHDVYSTWEKMRKRPECPICKQNKFKDNKCVIVPKKKGVARLLALDQSTHKTGWAIFDNDQLTKFGVYETTKELEIARCHEVKEWLISMIENWSVDVVALEGIQYQESFGVTTFQSLARLQGILMDLCWEKDLQFIVCPTNTWRAYCKVKGRARADRKRSMQLLVKEWFDISVTDDESDAIGIGKYATHQNLKQTQIVEWE